MTRRERRRDVVRVGYDEDGWALHEYRGPAYTVEIDDDGNETIVSDGPDDDDG